MYIILVRHGEAEPETDKVSNRSRRLTDKGRRQVKKSAELLKKLLGNQLLTVWASPYRRTRETAEVLVSELAGAEGVQVTDKLIQTSWALTSSQLIREGRPLILVSHQPILQSYLLSIASAGLKLAPASMAVIRYDVAWREGKLLAFLTPGLCRMTEDSYRESEEE